VETWETDVEVRAANSIKPQIVRQRKYTTTLPGQISANDLLPQSAELTEAQFVVLEKSLPMISPYGAIEWTRDVSNPLYQNGFKWHDSIRLFLVNNGFVKLEHIPGNGYDSTKTYNTLTDRGRLLKEIGSYAKYIEHISAKKIVAAKKEKLELELLETQITGNKSTVDTNYNTVANNRTMRRILSLTVFVAAISASADVYNIINSPKAKPSEDNKLTLSKQVELLNKELQKKGHQVDSLKIILQNVEKHSLNNR
jgi:hypothetical protein